MIKRVLLAVLLTVVYLAAFAAGSLLHPFGVTQVLGSKGLGVRLYLWDGVLLMLALFLLTLGLEAVGRRLRNLVSWTAASFTLAAFLGPLLRFGFVTKDF